MDGRGGGAAAGAVRNGGARRMRQFAPSFIPSAIICTIQLLTIDDTVFSAQYGIFYSLAHDPEQKVYVWRPFIKIYQNLHGTF